MGLNLCSVTCLVTWDEVWWASSWCWLLPRQQKLTQSAPSLACQNSVSVLVSWSMLGESLAASKWVDICLLSRLNHLSSVQFKMASVGWGKLIYTQQSCRFFRGAFDTVFVWLEKIFECFLFLHISPPGDHWSSVFSVLLAGSVSSVLNTSSISVNLLDVVQLDFFIIFLTCLK